MSKIVVDIDSILKVEKRVTGVRTKHAKFVTDMLSGNYASKGHLDPAKLADKVATWFNKDMSHVKNGSGELVSTYEQNKEFFIESQVELKSRKVLLSGGELYGMNGTEQKAFDEAMEIYKTKALPQIIKDAEMRLKIAGVVSKQAKAVAELAKA